jgi:hypothetical protein
MAENADLFNRGNLAIFQAQQALIATAAKAQSDVSLSEDKGAVDKHI